MALIEMEHITKRYGTAEGTVHALADVELCVESGEMVAILGRSGSGKSTLMNVMGCLDVPTAGEYRLAGRSVARMTEGELTALRRQTVGFVFQSFYLLPGLTARENVELPLLYRGIPEKQRRRMAEELCRMVEAAREYGVTVTLEDYDNAASPCSTSMGLWFFLQNVEGLGFTFDTGNFAYSMEDAMDGLLRPRVTVSIKNGGTDG